jgi:hypothetical protein
MTQENHDVHGAGFAHLRALLPTADSFAKIHEQRGTLGGNKQLSLFPGKNASNAYEQKALGEERVIGGAGGKRERRGRTNAESVDKSWMPQMLAEKLRDEKNLAFYKFVVRRLPEEIIRDALMRALDVPQRNIRRSRGALFASIVAPHLNARRRRPT